MALPTQEEWDKALAEMESLRAGFQKLLKQAHSVGGIQTPRMEGDNLAIILCSYFDDPEQPVDEETGWGADAIDGCNEVLAAIRKHFETN